MTMDYKRIFLYISIFLVSMMLWQAWQKEHPHPTIANHTAANTPTQQAVANNGNFVPPSTTATAVAKPSQPHAVAAQHVTPSARQIRIKTDVLDVTLDKQGGGFVRGELVKFPQEQHKDKSVALFSQAPGALYLAQSGVVSAAHKGQAKPIVFQSEKTQYQLTPDQKTLTVKLQGTLANGVTVEKELTFTAGSYLVAIQYRLHNTGNTPWQGQLYQQLLRQKPEKNGTGLFHMTSYTGASISDPKEKLYEKISFKSMKAKNVARTVTGGWVAMQQHYFLTAWVPPGDQTSRFYSHSAENQIYTIGMLGPQIKLAPNQTHVTQMKLYLGPEDTAVLKEIATGLNLTVDYGMLWFISVILFWLMKQIHSVVGNWGWSIILVTVMIKLAFYKLSATSYRSMANMKKLQPKLESIKQRFKGDKQKLSQATMELYKKEKINPLGGCLPIIIQIPVFIALYWVLLESVELRQAPFMFWIHDLSVKDPFYILPVIMGASMLIQQKLNPPPPDPMQAKVMMLMPILFTFLFLHFPAGLVLYWVVNNVLSIAQQWHITRQMENAPKGKAKPAK